MCAGSGCMIIEGHPIRMFVSYQIASGSDVALVQWKKFGAEGLDFCWLNSVSDTFLLQIKTLSPILLE